VEKYGVNKEILHEELRNEEARLMMEMSSALQDHTKTASDRSRIEQKLQQVRSKLTELDLGKNPNSSVQEP
jgi:ABC-type phosphate transport system auxiliary subunit